MSKARKSAKPKARKVPAAKPPAVSDGIAVDTKPVAAADRVRQPKFQYFLRGFTLLRDSLRHYRENPAITIAFLVVPALFTTFGGLLVGDLNSAATAPAPGRILGGFSLVVIGLLWLALNGLLTYYFTLKAARQGYPGIIETYRRGIRFVPRIIGLALLALPLFLAGLLLLIVPGLIVARRYYLAPLYIVDHDLGIRESMERSAAASRPVSFKVYGLITVTLLIATAATLLGRVLPPYGSLVGVVLGTVYCFAPAILYEEVRQTSAVKD